MNRTINKYIYGKAISINNVVKKGLIMEILEPEHYYHIYNHANGTENLFNCEENYCFFM